MVALKFCQAVRVGNALSDLIKLECGVPQGSRLCCVLFLIYIGDLPDWIRDGQVQGYADDTLHFLTAYKPEEANASKTAFIVFRPKKVSTSNNVQLTRNCVGFELLLLIQIVLFVVIVIIIVIEKNFPKHSLKFN